MRVIHIVPAITEEGSGPSYSVVRLCESLIAEGKDVKLAALDWSPIPSPPPFLKTFPLGFGPRRLGRSPEMKQWLERQVLSGNVKVLHNHGMWQMTAIYPGWIARKGKIKLVVSPRGSFSEWAMESGSKIKKVFWPLLQKPAFDQSTCFHATSGSEYEDIRRLGFRQPVAVIPNGIDIPDLLPKVKNDYRTLLFLGRIHQKKGLDMLLPAWRAVQDRFPDWRLRIVGSDGGYFKPSGYLAQMQRYAGEIGLKRIEFSGALYGEEKWRAYRNAELFVLPTYSENFGMSVAEALAAGIPAIVTNGAPWAGLETHNAGRWIDVGIDPLVAALETMMIYSVEDLAAIGQRGRDWMIRDYSWTRIGHQMAEVYDWMLGRTATPPTCVKLD